jgi:hypothetical protein
MLRPFQPKQVLMVMIPILVMTSHAHGASTVAILSTFANTSSGQLIVAGNLFKPGATGPTVYLGQSLVSLVSSTNTEIVATLPNGLRTGYSYRLVVENSIGQVAESWVSIPVPNPPQIYTGNFGAASNAGAGITSSFALTGGGFAQTIMPTACTIREILAALTPISGFSAPPYITLTLQQNGQNTSIAACEVSSSAPISCPLPPIPISVSRGDLLNYVLSTPGTGVEGQSYLGTVLFTTLCQ